MKRGSTRKPRRRNERDRALLTGLLVAIAVLLGVLIALLPPAAPDRLASAPSETDPLSQPDAERGADQSRRSDDTNAAHDAAEDREVAAEDREVAAEDREVAAGDDGAPRDEPEGDAVSESYPQDESRPPASPEEAPEDASDTWWLPVDVVPPDRRGPLVIVLDDAGNSLDAFAEFLAFPGPLAIAVLPQLDYSVRAAAMASAAGKEIMLHLPMEAVGGADPGPGAVGPSTARDDVARIVDANLATVPGAVGVNNHMGSLATADPAIMRAVLDHLKRRGLFFVDSRTSAETVGRAAAAEVGVPFAERDVFLDNVRTREAILSSFKHALELSQRGEAVVMIGHATVPLLAEIMNEIYPVLTREGYRFVGVSDLVGQVVVASGG